MRRWNGWGDTAIDYPLPDNASGFLEQLVGPGNPTEALPLEHIVRQVPASRLPHHKLVSQDAADRVRHARGQSLPDWVALRNGRIPHFPDGVARPLRDRDIHDLLDYARATGARVIPYGGGTSVVGHINTPASDQPVLVLNLERLNQLQQFDEANQLATFGAGIKGPDLEAQLRARGYTLGHFPQSFEYSTLGGWVATRSSGQQSLGYGRIENLFAGGVLISPSGIMEMLPHPASAAGPDLRHLVLGSEGRLGVISQATVRVSRLPEREDFHAVFFPSFSQGMVAVRQIMQANIPLSLLRLSTDIETTTTLALAGHEMLIGTLERLLAMRGLGEEKCMLLLGFTGSDAHVKYGRKAALEITGDHGGLHIGRTFGSQWHKGRFHTPYLRNTLWERGYAVDTLETAVTWNTIPALRQSIEEAIHHALQPIGEKVHVFTHLSHMYPQGASIYTTYLFRLADKPEDTLQRWALMKDAASKAIVAHKGTISHQHGVGTDHAPYLTPEKGELGMIALKNLIQSFDPDGMLNPGKLLTDYRRTLSDVAAKLA